MILIYIVIILNNSALTTRRWSFTVSVIFRVKVGPFLAKDRSIFQAKAGSAL